MAIPAWKLQLQQNIAKKKSEKQKQDEQRRIQMLPPWKRAALEHQNVIIISNTSSKSSSKSTTTVSNSTTKAVSTTNSRPTNTVVKTVNSNNSQTRTVSFVTANKKSPTHNVTKPSKDSGNITNSSSVQPANHVSLKQAGKSKSVDVIDNKKPSVVSAKLVEKPDNDKDGEFGVSDDHCISVHNNPFLRREKKMGSLARPNFTGISNQGLGNRQKVQDSTSPNSTSRVAWNTRSPPKDASPEKSTSSSNNNTSTKNNYITEKPKLSKSEASERPSRSTERKISVHDLMKQFGRAASHEEKEKVKRQGSLEEPLSPTSSPRSVSSHSREYSTRERSPSPVKRINRKGTNLKPRPKSTPVEISTSVILSQGRRSPITSPQPIRRGTYGNGTKSEKTRAPSVPTVTSSSNKVVINTSSKQTAPKTPAPKIEVDDGSLSKKPAASQVHNGSPAGVILINKKHLADYDNHDAGRTPPPRRKTPLPASAIIDLNTAGPIQQASGKPPVDPEQIAKEKSVSIPKNTTSKSGTHIKTRSNKIENDFEKLKPNTVSTLLGSFGQNKARAPAPPSQLASSTSNSVKDVQADAIPYPEDFRRPKTWQAKQQEEKPLPYQANLKHTEPAGSEKERNEKNVSISRKTAEAPVDLSPIPRTSSETISPIPKSENISPIPNREIISSDTRTVAQNGHIDSKLEESKTRGKGEASQEMMEKARALKKVKKKVNYEVIGGNEPTGKPSMQTTKSGRNRNKSQLKLTFQDTPEEYEYQSEASLLAEYGDEEEEEDEDRHSSEDEEESSPTAPTPSGFRDNVPKGSGGLQSYTPSYLRDLTPSMMREHQEATRRKEETPKQPEAEQMPYDVGDGFSSAGSSSAAMLF